MTRKARFPLSTPELATLCLDLLASPIDDPEDARGAEIGRRMVDAVVDAFGYELECRGEAGDQEAVTALRGLSSSYPSRFLAQVGSN